MLCAVALVRHRCSPLSPVALLLWEFTLVSVIERENVPRALGFASFCHAGDIAARKGAGEPCRRSFRSTPAAGLAAIEDKHPS